MRRAWLGMVVAAGASLALAACGGGGTGGGSPTASDVGVTKDQITLGATVPLSGPAAAYGTIAKASEAYFNYINATKGGVHGRKIKYVYLDDAYNPAQTVPLTHQLVEQDQVFATFGGLGTQAQTSVQQYLNAKKVPQVFVATGATTFSAGKDAMGHKWPYTFGWQPVYQGEALIYAQYLLQHSPNAKIGIIYQNDDYGQDYLNGLRKGLGSHQSMIVDVQNNDATAKDLSSQIVHLKSSGADTFFIFETPGPSIISLVTANAIGWHPQIFLNSVSAPIPYVQLAQGAAKDPAAVNGLLSVSYTKDPISPAFASDPGIQLYKQVMAQYYPTGKVNDAFNIYGMATAWSMVDALDHAGVNPTRASLLDALNTLNEPHNPFLLPGVTIQNTPSSHYSITQEEIAKYDAASGDYTAISGILNFRGKVRFP